ncbi:MAG: DNA primase large subunit PriL [Candidatus Bathyarchaeota archaeon]|nr:DNA primase large subunit PriL [Candidatus Bathyarchaeota archaeon]
MSQETQSFTPNDIAKYPFLKETAAYLQLIGLDIDELDSPELSGILNRAKERLENAVLYVWTGERVANDLEIPSFPVAIILALATKNSFIKKRYALAEAKEAFSALQHESNQRLIAIAKDFDWDIQLNKDPEIALDFVIGVADYLRNITHLRDENWKLVNRLLTNGKVYLPQHDIARLLQEEIQRRIEKRLETKELPDFPPKITQIAEYITDLAKEKIGESEMDGFPKIVSQSAFPPCIVALQDAATNGRHLSHIGRFALTSFLVTIGMPSEKVAEVFKTFSDYNARLTLYQVEHIAGERGSGTKYTPPSCSTLKTHGVCTNPDQLCQHIRHPLVYYKRKQPKPA